MNVPEPVLNPASFGDLAGFDDDDCREAFACFLVSCRAPRDVPRSGRPPSASLQATFAAARAVDANDPVRARAFFADHFMPHRVVVPEQRGFLTGYYQPRLRGSPRPSPRFPTPVLGRPDDLVTFRDGDRPPGLDPRLSGGSRLADGAVVPYPDRAAIEDAAASPVLWLEDPVELFMAQVQGGALVTLDDGAVVRLAYDGRNGQPYTSIGRLLIESGAIAEADMSLAKLKDWLRANGLEPGHPARDLMRRNRSYVFFKVVPDGGEPVAGAGVPLTPLRSIAVDRTLWSYGLPFFIQAELRWKSPRREPFRRLMIAQDTGSAILGAARADIYFGSGDEAGVRAGDIRDEGDFFVLLPKGERD
jgi:membrane-bound lytic murein transglycosylase A